MIGRNKLVGSDGIDLGIYSFVNTCRSLTDWNLLPEGAVGTSHGKTHIFKTRVRKVKTSEGK